MTKVNPPGFLFERTTEMQMHALVWTIHKQQRMKMSCFQAISLILCRSCLSNAIAVCLPIDAYIVEDDCPDPEGFRVVGRKQQII